MRFLNSSLMVFCFLFLISCGVESENAKNIKASPKPIEHFEGFFTDLRDNQTYRTVKIESQTWFAQNLNFKMANSFCYKKKKEFCDEYGRLYTWNSAVNSACPSGWRLPSKNDYEVLFNAIDHYVNAGKGPLESRIGVGKILKSKEGWLDKNIKASDDYGFTILPAGDMHDGGHFMNVKEHSRFWTITEIDEKLAYSISFVYSNQESEFAYARKNYGFSIRCIKN